MIMPTWEVLGLSITYPAGVALISRYVMFLYLRYRWSVVLSLWVGCGAGVLPFELLFYFPFFCFSLGQSLSFLILREDILVRGWHD
jgi:hypothetical protein